MQDALKNWTERLKAFRVYQEMNLSEHLNTQTVYSAMRRLKKSEDTKDWLFSIRQHPVTKVKYVIRTQ